MKKLLDGFDPRHVFLWLASVEYELHSDLDLYWREEDVQFLRKTPAGEDTQCLRKVSAGDGVQCLQKDSAGEDAQCLRKVSAREDAQCLQKVSAGESALQFSGLAYRVRVFLHAVEALPFAEENVIYRNEKLTVWKAGGKEYRGFYAQFLKPDSPLYAQTCFSKVSPEEARLDIYYLPERVHWENPNVNVWNFLHIEQVLLEVGAVVLHCCYTKYQGQAILFSAPSGTGKTTQGMLWKKYFGSDIINGDKAILMPVDGRWYAFGHPYHGSARECLNEAYPVKCISVVRQSPRDQVIKESPMRIVKDLYSEMTVNHWDAEAVNAALALAMDLAAKLPVVKQFCTMKEDAPKTLHKYMEFF